MSRRLNDGEAFEILNGRVIRPDHGPKASLAALQWAADRAGQSYGVFTQHLTPADEARIQLDYEDMLRQRKVEMAQRAQHVENVGTNPKRFMISEEDAKGQTMK